MMKHSLQIVQLQKFILTALKAIFNMENQAMSVACIKVEKPKSPFDRLQK